MNTHSPPPSPEEQACRITALLLGELNPRETDELRQAIERDPELTRLHDQLRHIIGLVREAVAQPADPVQRQASAPRFSAERRSELLRRFGGGVPTSVVTMPRRERPWIIPMSLAAALIALIAVAMLVLPVREEHALAHLGASLTEPERARAFRVGKEPDPADALLGRELARAEAPAVADEQGLRLARSDVTEGTTRFALAERESRLPRPTVQPSRGVVAGGPSPDMEVADGELVESVLGLAAFSGGGGGFGGGGGVAGYRDVEALSLEDRSSVEALMRERYGVVPRSAARPEESTRASDERSTTPVLEDDPLAGRLLKPSIRAFEWAESQVQREAIGAQGGTAPSRYDIEPRGPAAGLFFYSSGLDRSTSLDSRGERIAPIEVLTRVNRFSTFSLNVSDVSFKLAAASLDNGALPDPTTIRTEEFINAFDYRDAEPRSGRPLGFAWESAGHPFAHNRDLIRFAVKTAAQGREPGRALNLVLLLDNSGSMERADRVEIIREALGVLARHLEPQDRVSVVAFARTARLWIDGLPGDRGLELVDGVGNLTPQGGTNLEAALRLGYETARQQYLADGVNRVILLTDGAANLGDVEPDSLKQIVETHRRQGIALDCFGIGWEGYNDDLLEVLSRHGDGRYGFVNSPAEVAGRFADQLAGALHVAAADVKVQIEFNPDRVIAYRQLGYETHQLAQEQFRDDTVDAAEIGAAEAGNALYAVQLDPDGRGPVGHVRVRFKVPATGEYQELEWVVPYRGRAPALAATNRSMRLAGVAALTAEWLAESPFAADITGAELLALLRGVPESYGPDPRPAQLERMIRQARVLGKQ